MVGVMEAHMAKQSKNATQLWTVMAKDHNTGETRAIGRFSSQGRAHAALEHLAARDPEWRFDFTIQKLPENTQENLW